MWGDTSTKQSTPSSTSPSNNHLIQGTFGNIHHETIHHDSTDPSQYSSIHHHESIPITSENQAMVQLYDNVSSSIVMDSRSEFPIPQQLGSNTSLERVVLPESNLTGDQDSNLSSDEQNQFQDLLNLSVLISGEDPRIEFEIDFNSAEYHHYPEPNSGYVSVIPTIGILDLDNPPEITPNTSGYVMLTSRIMVLRFMVRNYDLLKKGWPNPKCCPYIRYWESCHGIQCFISGIPYNLIFRTERIFIPCGACGGEPHLMETLDKDDDDDIKTKYKEIYGVDIPSIDYFDPRENEDQIQANFRICDELCDKYFYKCPTLKQVLFKRFDYRNHVAYKNIENHIRIMELGRTYGGLLKHSNVERQLKPDLYEKTKKKENRKVVNECLDTPNNNQVQSNEEKEETQEESDRRIQREMIIRQRVVGVQEYTLMGKKKIFDDAVVFRSAQSYDFYIRTKATPGELHMVTNPRDNDETLVLKYPVTPHAISGWMGLLFNRIVNRKKYVKLLYDSFHEFLRNEHLQDLKEHPNIEKLFNRIAKLKQMWSIKPLEKIATNEAEHQILLSLYCVLDAYELLLSIEHRHKTKHGDRGPTVRKAFTDALKFDFTSGYPEVFLEFVNQKTKMLDTCRIGDGDDFSLARILLLLLSNEDLTENDISSILKMFKKYSDNVNNEEEEGEEEEGKEEYEYLVGLKMKNDRINKRLFQVQNNKERSALSGITMMRRIKYNARLLGLKVFDYGLTFHKLRSDALVNEFSSRLNKELQTNKKESTRSRRSRRRRRRTKLPKIDKMLKKAKDYTGKWISDASLKYHDVSTNRILKAFNSKKTPQQKLERYQSLLRKFHLFPRFCRIEVALVFKIRNGQLVFGRRKRKFMNRSNLLQSLSFLEDDENEGDLEEKFRLLSLLSPKIVAFPGYYSTGNRRELMKLTLKYLTGKEHPLGLELHQEFFSLMKNEFYKTQVWNVMYQNPLYRLMKNTQDVIQSNILDLNNLEQIKMNRTFNHLWVQGLFFTYCSSVRLLFSSKTKEDVYENLKRFYSIQMSLCYQQLNLNIFYLNEKGLEFIHKTRVRIKDITQQKNKIKMKFSSQSFIRDQILQILDTVETYPHGLGSVKPPKWNQLENILTSDLLKDMILLKKLIAKKRKVDETVEDNDDEEEEVEVESIDDMGGEDSDQEIII